MSKLLVVPLHLDALLLKEDRLVTEATADFSSLPYFDPRLQREINSDRANLSEECVSVPFQSQNLFLKAGVHLHWALPDALTRAVQRADATVFPAVPNRWLITRVRGSRPEKNWVVESDYIHPLPRAGNHPYEDYANGPGARSGSISYFYREIDPGSPEPFRFVGRQITLCDWIAESLSGTAPKSHFPETWPLTAIGYGELTFAAFYPNCHSVFGFHDGDCTRAADLSGCRYDLLGWYACDGHDPLKRWLVQDAILTTYTAGSRHAYQGLLDGVAHLSPIQNAPSLKEILDGLLAGQSLRAELRDFLEMNQAFAAPLFDWFQKDETLRPFLQPGKIEPLGWKFPADPLSKGPERTLLFSSIEFKGAAVAAAPPPKGEQSEETIDIAVGNSTMEALSSYLAHQIAKNHLNFQDPTDSKHAARMERLEDQIESLYLAGKLGGRVLDVGPKFREARHDVGFAPVSGGIRWTLDLQSSPEAGLMALPDSANAADAGQHLPKERGADALGAQTQRRVTPPRDLLAQLDRLNEAQWKVDRIQGEIDTLRRQLFADWYKYMLSLYHPADAIRGDDYPDIDRVRHFIEETSCKPLEAKETELAAARSGCEAEGDRMKQWLGHTNESLAGHLRPPEDGGGLKDFGQVIPSRLNVGLATAGSNGSRPRDPRFDRWLVFDGTGFASCAWQSPPRGMRRGVTVSAWVYADPPGEGKRSVFAVGDLILGIEPLPNAGSGQFGIGVTGVSERFGRITAERWYHLALTCELPDSGSPRMDAFIDGHRYPLLWNTDSKDFGQILAGRAPADGVAFRGRMTHIRVDNRALSPAEIRRDQSNGIRPVYRLYEKAAPRFWQPAEPVVLLTGKGIRASERHGQDGRFDPDGALECAVIDGDLFDQSSNREAFGRELSELHQRLEQLSSKGIATRGWDGQPWNPILLEWEVLLQPAQAGATDTGAYSPDLILANYHLPDNGCDLKVRHDRRDLAAGTLYSNASPLTAHSGDQLRQRIAEYLDDYLEQVRVRIEEENREESEVPEPAANRRERIAHWQQRHYRKRLKDWFNSGNRPKPRKNSKDPLDRQRLVEFRALFETKPVFGQTGKVLRDLDAEARADDPAYVIVLAGIQLFHEDGSPRAFLSQALGGFNEEFLMRKETLQLPVDDPLAFPQDRAFNQRVARLLDHHILSAPEPSNQFHPIRTGALSITRLRLIDSFGQVMDLNQEKMLQAGRHIITPQRLTVPDKPDLIWLPPRFIQPVRVEFNWLKSRENDPEATPICGWVLPDNLQHTLAFYDEKGAALGSIMKRLRGVEWVPAPGSNREVDEIRNPHLRKLVIHLLLEGKDHEDRENFLRDFLTTIESALETFHPESHAQHRSLALLMGRPIAVVRASLDLQMQGSPAVAQGWHAFQSDLFHDQRQTNAVTQVKVPFRIGEFQQLNDGVVGYWIEDGDGYRDGIFYAPQSPDDALNQSINHASIVIHHAPQEGDSEAPEHNPLNRIQTIDSEPEVYTLLFDPRAKVHITSGILPTKVAEIPAPEYAPALEAIQVSFLAAPLLTAHGTRSVPLPVEPGFTWSWREHHRWITKSAFRETLTKASQDERITGNIDLLWNRLQACGWIEPAGEGEDGRHRIFPMGRRASEQFDIILKTEFFELFAETRSTKPTGSPPDIGAVWDYLIHPAVRWLHASRAAIDEAGSVARLDRAEIVPKDRRVLARLQAAGSAPAAWDFEDLERRVQQVFDLLLVIDLDTAWEAFGVLDRGESIARLEDWLERMFWADYTEQPLIERETFLDQLQNLTRRSRPAPFTPAEARAVWDHLAANGTCWLRPVPATPAWARVVPPNERLAATLGAVPGLESVLSGTEATGLQVWVERILRTESLELSPVDRKAAFETHHEIREGWLVLQRESD